MDMTEFAMRSSVIGENPRCLAIDEMESHYNGKFYSTGMNAREYSWDTEIVPGTERNKTPEKVPLSKRRPKQFNLARYIVDRSAGWLVGGRYFPRLIAEGDPGTQEWIDVLKEALRLPSVWLKAAKQGGKGKTAVVVGKIVNGYLRVEHLPAKYCLPRFGDDGETLTYLRLQFKIPGDMLDEMGIPGVWDPKELYWFRREYTPDAEVNFYPVRVARDGRPPEFVEDPDRTVRHGLGVLAAVWIRNLPSDDPLDGEATYEPVVDLFDPINVMASLAYRSIKKLSDPTLVLEDIKEDDDIDAVLSVGSSAGATISIPGKAKLLEMTGSGQAAAKEWVSEFRQGVATISRVTNPDPEKLAGAAQSGYALEVLHAPLIELVEELRETYGPALVQFVRLMLALVAVYKLRGGKNGGPGALFLPREEPTAAINPKATLTVSWGRFFAPSLPDIKALIETLAAAVAMGAMSMHTAIAKVCEAFGVTDIEGERARIKAEATGGENGLEDAIAELGKKVSEKRAEGVAQGSEGEPDDDDEEE